MNVFGGVESERLQVTENSFLTKRNLTNALDIRLRFVGGKGEAKDYTRSLELETGLSRARPPGSCRRKGWGFFWIGPDF